MIIIAGGTEIFKVGEQEPIGHVTSGCPSPVLRGQNISMGYVKRETSKAGTQVIVVLIFNLDH